MANFHFSTWPTCIETCILLLELFTGKEKALDKNKKNVALSSRQYYTNNLQFLRLTKPRLYINMRCIIYALAFNSYCIYFYHIF